VSTICIFHKSKRNPDISEEEYEKALREMMKLWTGPGRCKQVFLLKSVSIPWQSSQKSDEFDFLWISVWDAEEHRKFCEGGGFGRDRAELKAFWEKADELNPGKIVGGLGFLEVVDVVEREE
jgi:hypothetical protein